MVTGLDSRQTKNLPRPFSTFIGRSKEIIKVSQLVLENRLVTLTGAGGSGKTRLALEVGHKLAGEFHDRVWFVDLSSITDASLIPQKIVSTLKILEKPGQSGLEAIVNFLSMHPTFLILDNCEHLISDCADIAENLLQNCAELRILATSREVLGITGEVAWAVPPLSLPEIHPNEESLSEQVALDQYKNSESVQLFVERAAAHSPEFKLSIHSAAWVAEICRHLDGMPLAIELAAAQSRSLTVQEIARRLDNRFNMLIGGSRTAPPRHQTLAATIDWSYRLLNNKEKKVLQRLSVFAGGAVLTAAEVVCSGEDVATSEVLEALSQLVDKSLIKADKLDHGETRYRLLETIGEYANEKLTQSNEYEDIRNNHLDFFLQLAEKANQNLRGPEEIFWYERLDAEHDNLREALGWALKSNNADAGLRLSGNLGYFWFIRGHSREGITWLERTLEQREGAQESSIAHALGYLGGMLNLSEKRELHQTAQILEESLMLYRELGNEGGIAWILNQLGINAAVGGEEKKAMDYYDQSLAIRRELGDPWFIAKSLQNYSPFYLKHGDFENAKLFAEETITWYQRAGYQRGVARATMDLANIAQLGGDSDQAGKLLTESLSHLLRVGDQWSAAEALEKLAALAFEERDPIRAAILFGAAEAFRETVGMLSLGLDYESYQEEVKEIRDSVSEKKFARAWEMGRAMPFEQVVAFVLGDSNKSSSIQEEEPGGLTPREREAAILIAQGMSNREIAEGMTVTIKTVEAYITRIRQKLGFDSRVQIATWVFDNDIK